MTDANNNHGGEKLEKANSEEVPQQGETTEDADAQTAGTRKDTQEK